MPVGGCTEQVLRQKRFSAILFQMSKQLDMFKTNLEEFASKHKQEIRKNPEFRVQFQDMCATIGVDPLACEEQAPGLVTGDSPCRSHTVNSSR